MVSVVEAIAGYVGGLLGRLLAKIRNAIDTRAGRVAFTFAVIVGGLWAGYGVAYLASLIVGRVIAYGVFNIVGYYMLMRYGFGFFIF